MVTDAPCKDAKNCKGFLCVCDVCGAEFCVAHHRIREGRGKFCKHSCYTTSNKRPLADRFWEKVDKNGPIMPGMTTPCWVWTGYRMPFGHGQINSGDKNGRAILVHRFSWELHNGRPLAEGMESCHHCDNPPCVRPDHLFEGTQKDNMADAKEKGRTRNGFIDHPELAARGEQHGMAKLTVPQVIEIYRRRNNGEKRHVLAIEFGVSNWTIGEIAHRRAWKHILNP